MGFWNKSEPDGINTNPEFKDRTRYAPIPFVIAVPQLSQVFYKALHGVHYKKKLFLEWKASPGDHVQGRSLIGQFNLKSRAWFGGSKPGEILMPNNGIITETLNSETSKYLFAYQPLLPLTEAEKYRHMPVEQAEKSLRFIPVPLPYGRLCQDVFMALRYDEDGQALRSEDNVNYIINDEIDKMGYVTVIPVLNR
ncbi:MAG: hypothetical protein DYH13_06500 [Alphaproteobacteria bacterium PRO2]|nr:hypothetical protein [Alphaproteobacteria bacterium PRO2]